MKNRRMGWTLILVSFLCKTLNQNFVFDLGNILLGNLYEHASLK